MSSFLRRIPTNRLIALCAAVVAVAVAGTAIAVAAGSGGAVPPQKSLATAIHDALAAPNPQGVTADVTFTNHLIDGLDLRGSNPILSGATGRLWAANDGRFRLELQGNGGGGDAQIVSDGKSWWVYDGQNTVYRGSVPQHKQDAAGTQKHDQVPSVSTIQQRIGRVMQQANVSAAQPTDVGGQPAYSVRVSPKKNGGLLGGVELAWDASHGIPLRVGIYAKGASQPVLELALSNVSFGSVDASALNISPPAGTKSQHVSTPQQGTADKKHSGHPSKPVTGLSQVQAGVPFKLAAPSSLAGRTRQGADLLGHKGKTGDAGAVVTYGNGLDGIAVIERSAGTAAKGHDAGGPLGNAQLPTVTINGTSAQELSTPLGTVIRFERGGVSYTVIGSVSKTAAESAARGL